MKSTAYRPYMLFLSAILTICSCTSQQSAQPEFPESLKPLSALAPPLSLPFSWTDAVPRGKTLPDSIGQKYLLESNGSALTPTGWAAGKGWYALLYILEPAPNEEEWKMALFDAKGTLIQKMAIGGHFYNTQTEHFQISKACTLFTDSLYAEWLVHQGNSDEGLQTLEKLEYQIKPDALLTLANRTATQSPLTQPEAEQPNSPTPATSTHATLINNYVSNANPKQTLHVILPYEAAPLYAFETGNTVTFLPEDNQKTQGNTIAFTSKVVNSATWQGMQAATIQGYEINAPKALLVQLSNAQTNQFTLSKQNSGTLTPGTYRRTPPPATEESFGASAQLAITQTGSNTYTVTWDVNSGAPQHHICQQSQPVPLIVQGRVAYLHSIEDVPCMLAMVQTGNTLWVYTYSSAQQCGCGAAAWLEGEYKLQ